MNQDYSVHSLTFPRTLLRARHLVALCGFALILASRAFAQVDVLYFYNLANVGQSPPAVTDMCAAVTLAASKYPGLTLDARGFTGVQYCSAANATTMLGSVTSGVRKRPE
jgi:hypothetical protein